MKREKEIIKVGFYIIAVLIGVFSFIAIYGVRVLNPCYDDWLLRGGDLTQHYIGWEFYRDSDWQFPLGLMDAIAYPNKVSVIFTDSIPIFALFFKLLSPILPKTFQYFGWWQLLCFILQAVLSAKVLFCFTKQRLVSLIGSLFLVVSPVFIARVFFHTALSSQWLLLLALYMGVKYLDESEINIRKMVIMWGMLGVLCGVIHMYYIPMCGIIMLGFLLARVLREKNIINPIMIGGIYIIGAGSAVMMLGGFSHDHQLDAGGLGQFSFNMNGFFNSMGWSKIFPALSAYGEGSSDGFSYLGLGIFVLLFISLFWGVYERLKKREDKKDGFNYTYIAYGFICLVCILVSVSHKFALNGEYVFTLPYPQKLVSLWGMFRASGRFIWTMYYLIFIYAVVMLTKHVKKTQWVVGVLLCTFVIQIYDISGVLQAKRGEFVNEVTYNNKLQDEAWEELAEGKKHVVFVSNVVQNQDILYSVSQYAYLHGMSINNFYLAHSAVAGDIQESLEKSMRDLQEDTIYIFKLSDEGMCREYELEYRVLDEIIVGVVGD